MQLFSTQLNDIQTQIEALQAQQNRLQDLENGTSEHIKGLEIAIGIAKDEGALDAIARSNTVRSIHWQNAPIATRFEVAAALEEQGDLIVNYLKKFKQYWNRAIDGLGDIEGFLRSLPIPNYSTDAEIYHSIRRQELGESIYFLGQLEREFNQKLLKERCCFKSQ